MKLSDSSICNPGRFDQQLTIQSATWSKSASGGDVATWGTFARVRGAVSMKKGAEKFDGGSDNSEKWVDVQVHRMKGIREEMRIIWNSELLGPVVLDVRNVQPATDRSLFMVLNCRILK